MEINELMWCKLYQFHKNPPPSCGHPRQRGTAQLRLSEKGIENHPMSIEY